MIRKEAYNAVKNKQKRDEGEADLQLGQLLPDCYTCSNEATYIIVSLHRRKERTGRTIVPALEEDKITESEEVLATIPAMASLLSGGKNGCC